MSKFMNFKPLIICMVFILTSLFVMGRNSYADECSKEEILKLLGAGYTKDEINKLCDEESDAIQNFVTPPNETAPCNHREFYWQFGPDPGTPAVFACGISVPIEDIIDDYNFTNFWHEGFEGNSVDGISGSGYIKNDRIVWGYIDGVNCVGIRVTREDCGDGSTFKNDCAYGRISIQPKNKNKGGFSNIRATVTYKQGDDTIRTTKVGGESDRFVGCGE